MSYWPKSNYVFPPPTLFIHIPKTAGITIQDWYRNTYGKFYKCMHGDVRHPVIEQDLEHTPGWCVVRNPYDLCFSWYRYKRQMLTEKRHRDPIELQHWRVGFENWLDRYIEKINYTKDKMTDGFNPISPSKCQLDYITGRDGEIKVKWILRFETLADDIEQINSYVAGNYQLQHQNKTEIQIKDGYRGAYTDKARKIVEKYYARDLEYFGYEF